MAFHPSMIVESKVRQLSEKYDTSPEMIRGVLSDFIESLHETCFKGSVTDALKGMYFTMGPEIAWHFWGIIYRSFEGNGSDTLSDSRGSWLETALRMDSRMKRFSSVLDRWSEEHEFELKEHELEEPERTNDNP